MIHKHLNKDNLHHAYLIEGDKEKIVPEILEFCRILDIKISGNPDFCHISVDNFKIDEAFNLRAMSANKAVVSLKKIFIISVNNFSLDAQNVLLKMFEEPIENTHFFLIVPDSNMLLKTLVSRFYLIKNKDIDMSFEEAERFIKMSTRGRIDFLKELLVEPEDEDEDGNETVALDSIRSKALKFLNALEFVLHKNMSKMPFDTGLIEHFFKVREFLRMPGSFPKTLMESVALMIPEKV